MISFLPAIIWLILLPGFVKPEWTTDSGNQSADGRMDPTALFSTGQCGLCAYVSEKMGTLYRLFHRIRIIGSAMKNVMKAWKAACAVFGLCTILAIADEAHKVLIVGRHCQWDEAGINIVGVIMGVLLTWSILWLIRWARGTLED